MSRTAQAGTSERAARHTFFDVTGLAELLGVDRRLVSKLVRNGEIASVRVGRLYRISSEALDAFLARNGADSRGGTEID